MARAAQWWKCCSKEVTWRGGSRAAWVPCAFSLVTNLHGETLCVHLFAVSAVWCYLDVCSGQSDEVPAVATRYQVFSADPPTGQPSFHGDRKSFMHGQIGILTPSCQVLTLTVRNASVTTGEYASVIVGDTHVNTVRCIASP